MQSNIISKSIGSSTLKPLCGQLVVQVRHHVKMWPWRKIRTARESHLDNTKTPYTEGHNINEFKVSEKRKKPWQIVIPKDKDSRYNQMNWNPIYESDPVQAKEFSRSQMEKFEKSLIERGPSRESKPYEPPANVTDKVFAILKSTLLNSEQTNSPTVSTTDDSLATFKLDSIDLKFKLLSKCIESFKHNLPSSYLNEINTVADVIDYFNRPVRGINSYAAMTKTQESLLPGNLYLLPEAIRFDKDNNSYFKDLNALPGTISKVPGLRGSKKYAVLNQDEFQWPDI